jgi:hypothetical protein
MHSFAKRSICVRVLAPVRARDYAFCTRVSRIRGYGGRPELKGVQRASAGSKKIAASSSAWEAHVMKADDPRFEKSPQEAVKRVNRVKEFMPTVPKGTIWR